MPLNEIDRSYERLVKAGGAVNGFLSADSRSTARPAFPQCARGGCHRPATKQWRGRHWMQPWDLCEPCYDAIVSNVF